MKTHKFLIIFISFFLGLSNSLADERKKQLDKLFLELKTNNPILTF